MTDRHLPTFSGYTSSESIITFFEDFELFVASKALTAPQRLYLFEAALRGPARAAYDQGVNGGGNAWGGNDENAQYTNRKAQMIALYHNANAQQEVKDQINALYQELEEDPLTFYTRIRHLLPLAGYADAVRDQVAETVFMNGLHKEIALAIRSSPTVLNLTNKVDYAHRYWTARHPNTSVILPDKFRSRPGDRKIETIVPRREEPEMDQLTKQFAEMKLMIADLQRQIKQTPVQRFGVETTQRSNRDGYGEKRGPIRCYRCGEEGHFSKDCLAETARVAQTSNRSTKLGAHMATPIYEIREIFDDFEDEPMEYYPAVTRRRPGRPPKQPTSYERPSPDPEKDGDGDPLARLGREQGKKLKEQNVRFEEVPSVEELNKLVDIPEVPEIPEIQDVPMSESKEREARLRKTKKYQYNAWEDIKSRQAGITFEQLGEIAPTTKQQIRSGLSGVRPGFEIVEINTARNEESEEEEDTRKTSAYTTCQIEDKIVQAIIDTGAGGCIMSKALLDRLGWGIEEATKMTFVVADGATATPLGKVRQVPVRFGGTTIPIDVIVTQTTSYDIILGNDWLAKSRAVIDLNAEKMKITWRGRTWQIPLNLQKGVRPEMIEDEKDVEDNEYFAVQTTRNLTAEERAICYERMLQDQRCAFCHVPVYCAELACSCPLTVRVDNQCNIDHEWDKRQVKKKPRQENPVTRKPPDLPWIEYNTRQWKSKERSTVHPFVSNNNGTFWDDFWRTVPYVGRNRLIEDRDTYDVNRIALKERRRKHPRLLYWDEVNPNDVLTVLRAKNENFCWPARDENQLEVYTVIEVKRTHPHVKVPQQMTSGAAGFDLQATEEIELNPGESTVMPTGLAFGLPQGYFGLIKPRSSLARVGLTVDGGVIDCDYRGEVSVILVNRCRTNPVRIYQYDRVAQMVVLPYLRTEMR